MNRMLVQWCDSFVFSVDSTRFRQKRKIVFVASAQHQDIYLRESAVLSSEAVLSQCADPWSLFDIVWQHALQTWLSVTNVHLEQNSRHQGKLVSNRIRPGQS